MDFLKQQFNKVYGQVSFPYKFHHEHQRHGDWQWFSGTVKEDQSPVSIFKAPQESVTAQNALKKLRVLRHPCALRLIDVVSTDPEYVYVITEACMPISTEDDLVSGIWNVCRFLSFLHKDTYSVHGNLTRDAVVKTASGEWKVFGFDYLSCVKNDGDLLWNGYKSQGYLPPTEAQNDGLARIKAGNVAIHSFDVWLLAVMVWQLYNGNGSLQDIQQRGPVKVPQSLWQVLQRYLVHDPNLRPTVDTLLTSQNMLNPSESQLNDAFASNAYVVVADFLDNVTIKSTKDKADFFRQLQSYQLSDEFIKFKLAPGLCNAVEFGSVEAQHLKQILEIRLKFYDAATFSQWICRLFGMNDRLMRLALLDNLSLYVQKLDKTMVNDKIFTQLITGFSDSAPQLREATLRSVVTWMPLLTDRNINGDLMRCLSKCQQDSEAAIRANTVICLGKISKYLQEAVRKKILVQAFILSLKDPFPPSRTGAIQALNATSDLYDAQEQACRIVPAIAPLMVDSDNGVRQAAIKAIQQYISRLTKYSDELASREPSVSEQVVSPNKPTQQVIAVKETPVVDQRSTNQVLETNAWDSLGDWGDGKTTLQQQPSSIGLQLGGFQTQSQADKILQELDDYASVRPFDPPPQQVQSFGAPVSNHSQQVTSDLQRKREEHKAKVEALKQQRRLKQESLI